MPVKGYKKIAFIAGTLGTGGAERQLFYLSASLVKHGYEVTVYCLTQHEFYESKLKENGVDVIYFGAHSSRLKRVRALYLLLRAHRPHLVYSFHFYTNTYASIAGRLLGLKVIGSIRSDALSEKRLNGRLSWLHYSLPNSIIANSRHGADNCKKIFYKKPMFILGNVIEADKFQYVSKSLDDKKPIKIIWVGRYVNEKQPWLFPQVIKNLTDHGLNVSGEMYGEGKLKDELKELINHQFQNYQVTLKQTHPMIQEVYKNAHWLCSLSKYEGSPNVVIEAMASGVAIASLKYDGIDALISNEKNGLIQDDIEKLCVGIIKFSHQELYNSLTMEARKKIEENYSLKNLIPNFEEILGVV
jgi:glycosyltransferase involved in cell wall biosynthesis